MEASTGRRVFVGNLAYATRWQRLKEHLSQAGSVVHADVLMAPDGRSKGYGIAEFETREQALNAIATLTDTELDGRNIFVRPDRDDTGAAAGAAQAPSAPPRPSAPVQPTPLPAAAAATLSAAPPAAERAPRRPPRNAGSSPPPGPSPAGGANGAQGQSRFEPRACYKCGGVGHLASECTRAEGEIAGRKLFVSNLAYSISWQDLKDIFAEFGPVTRADVFLERPGRSKGVGVVVMESSADAKKAIEGLNGREVRGRALTVKEDTKL